MPSCVEDCRKWLKLSCRSLVFTSNKHKAFLKNKKKFGTSLPASFSAWFLKKNISFVMFFYLTKFQCLVVFTSWDIGEYVYCNSLLTRFWRNKFWNKHYLSNQAVFSTWPKLGQKFKYFVNEKSFYDEIKSIFRHFLNGFHWSKWKYFCLEGEGPTLS